MARECKRLLYFGRTSPDRSSARLRYPSAPRTATPWCRFFAARTSRFFGRLNLRSMPTLSSTRAETLMALQLGKPKMPASKPRKDEERETRQAIIEDADKTDGK